MRYQVKDPQGNIHEIDGPENATPEQIIAAAKSIIPPTSAPAPKVVADEIGPVQATVIGAGRTADKVVQGMKQLYYGATGNQPELDAMRADEADKNARYAQLQARRPLATGIGEAIPAMAIPMGGAGAGFAGMVGRGALAGALPGALSYGTAGERASRGTVGAIGGGVGGGLGFGASRLLQPVRATAGASDEALAAAARLGYKPSPGQVTQNPALMNFENYLARSPGSSGQMQALNAANQNALNAAGARAMGEGGTSLSEGTFAAAGNRLGNEFSRLQNITAPQLGDDFLSSLAKIDATNVAKGPFARPEVSKLVDKGLDLAAQGKLSGTAYKEIHTELANASKSAFRGGDATLGQAYKTVREALDSAAEESLSKADQNAWNAVRKQWTAYRLLSKSNVTEAGNLSAPRAAAAIRQMGPQLRTGQMTGDIADIGRVGEAFKGVQNPNSGQLAQQMLFGNPITGLPAAAVNNLTARAYLSPVGQQYAAGGLLAMTPEREVILQSLMRGAGLLGTSQFLGAR